MQGQFMRKIIAMITVALSGCAANSGVVATGADTYFVSRQAATGITGMGNLKGEALGEAGQFCSAKGKALQVISQSDTKPPYILGNYPKTELQFKCS
jgi:hypothetical protein